MAEGFDDAAVVKRANWVGLRTIRQRPKVVGHTGAGEPVFEAKSVRMILREDGTHFTRLVDCSRCHKEVTGSSVRSAADLDRPTHSIICKDCVRASAMTSQQPARPVATHPVDPVREEPPAPPRPVEHRDDGRLAKVESQLQAVVYRLSELADAQAQEASVRGRAVEEMAAQVVPLIGTVQDLRHEGAAQLSAMAERVRADLDRRLAEMAEQLAALPAEPPHSPDADATSARLDALQAAVEELRRAPRPDLTVPEQLQTRLAALETQLADQSVEEVRSAVAAETERRGRDDENLRRSQDELREGLDGVLERLQATADAGAALEQRFLSRLQGLETQVASTAAGVTARADSLQAEADRRSLEGEELRRSFDELRQGLAGVEQGVLSQVQGLETQAAAAAEAAIGEVRAALAAEAERRQHEDDAVRGSLDQIRLGADDDAAQVRREIEEGRRSQSEEIEQVRRDLADQRARAQQDVAAGERSARELDRVGQQLDERIQGLAGWLAEVAQADEARVGALEATIADRLEEAVAQWATSQREAMETLRRELAEVRAAIPVQETSETDRIDTLEKALEARDTEVSDLVDFHGLLDKGMGELRAELSKLKSATHALADAQADMQDRLDVPVTSASPVADGRAGRRRREGKRTEIATETPAALAMEELARRQQRFEDQLARLEELATGATLAASTQASRQASALGPLRNDVKALHEQLAAQADVIASLQKSLDGLRPTIPAPAAAKKAAAKKVATSAAKKSSRLKA